MATYHGSSAKSYFNSADIFKPQSWSLETSSDTASSDAQGETWKAFEEGLEDFTATVEGLAETTVDYTSTLAVNSALRLYIDDTNYLSATAICTSITETASINDVGKVTYSFEGDDTSGIAYT